MDLNDKTILVTGGCGFIGSNFIEYVFEYYKNVTIINVDKHGVGSRPNFCKHPRYMEVVLDLSDPLLNKPDLRGYAFDYVFHFAAESHVDRSIEGPEVFIKNNVCGITNLLEYLRATQKNVKMVNVSTDEVYGHLKRYQTPFLETTSLDPRSPYAASKAAADLVANSYIKTFGMDIITTRCCNNYGPHQYKEKFIPTVIGSICKGNRIPVYGKGENIREWIHVMDHVKSILEIVEVSKTSVPPSVRTFNIGSGKELANLELVNKILDLTSISIIKDPIEFVEDRLGHDYRYAIESLFYRRSFDLVNFDEGLLDTVRFYEEKG